MLFMHLRLNYMCGYIIVLSGVYVNMYNSLIRPIKRRAARLSDE